MIDLEGVSKDYGAGEEAVHAVKDATLHINEGEIFGIIGFSGAGKSTLVRCINLLERPTAGKVTVDGKDMLSLSPSELRRARRNIGMIFQHFNLMPSRTVFGNVAYPLKGSGLSKAQINEKVHKLLELVEIGDKANAYPSQLSGGQKQRVAIARALANDPKVLLSDEATSALDPQTTKAILRLIVSLKEKLGLTVVVITHEMAVIKEVCDHVAVMENGVIVEQGTVFDVFANPQAQLTRNFVNSTSNLHRIEELVAQKSPVVALKPGEVVVRLSYKEKNAARPLISEAARLFDVDFNVIFADITIVDGAPIGGTVAIVSGEGDNPGKALEYLTEKHVEVEVVADGR